MINKNLIKKHKKLTHPTLTKPGMQSAVPQKTASAQIVRRYLKSPATVRDLNPTPNPMHSTWDAEKWAVKGVHSLVCNRMSA